MNAINTRHSKMHWHDYDQTALPIRLKPASCLLALAAAWMLYLFLPADAVAAAKKGHTGQASTILGLTQEKKAEGVIINIRGDGTFKDYKVFMLKDPPRLVLDFPGVTFPDGPDAYRGPDETIDKIRIGRQESDRTRVVFDFHDTAGVPYHIVEEGSVLHVEFATSKEENTTPQVKIVKPDGDIVVSLGDTVTFASDVTGGNGPVVHEWAISGNGISKTMSELDALKFDQLGSFIIVCHAADRDGDQATASITVTVKAPRGSTTGATETAPSMVEQVSPQEPGRFSLFFGDGIYHTGSAGDFFIAVPETVGHTIWSLTRKDNCMLTVGGAYTLTDQLELDLGLSGNVGDSSTTLFLVSAGPKVMTPDDGGMGAYLRGGPTFGYFSWSEAPGDFDPAIGWEIGGGATMPLGNWKLGIDLGYRGISFAYNPPDIVGVVWNKDDLDFSGYSVNFMFQYPL
jgi:hypothetical protein